MSIPYTQGTCHLNHNNHKPLIQNILHHKMEQKLRAQNRHFGTPTQTDLTAIMTQHTAPRPFYAETICETKPHEIPNKPDFRANKNTLRISAQGVEKILFTTGWEGRYQCATSHVKSAL